MTERPILFSTEMVKAIMDGRKTQTRRIIKPQPTLEGSVMWWKGLAYDATYRKWAKKPNWMESRLCPYGRRGGRLWVRERWYADRKYDGVAPSKIPEGSRIRYAPELYLPTAPHPEWAGKTRPGIFMPRWASQILLEIVDVRVERLQDITEADAQAEGLEGFTHTLRGWPPAEVTLTPRGEFFGLWNQIHGKDAWDANPFVWVVEFKWVKP